MRPFNRQYVRAGSARRSCPASIDSIIDVRALGASCANALPAVAFALASIRSSPATNAARSSSESFSETTTSMNAGTPTSVALGVSVRGRIVSATAPMSASCCSDRPPRIAPPRATRDQMARASRGAPKNESAAAAPVARRRSRRSIVHSLSSLHCLSPTLELRDPFLESSNLRPRYRRRGDRVRGRQGDSRGPRHRRRRSDRGAWWLHSSEPGEREHAAAKRPKPDHPEEPLGQRHLERTTKQERQAEADQHHAGEHEDDPSRRDAKTSRLVRNRDAKPANHQ